jgi:hypothetical protein
MTRRLFAPPRLSGGKLQILRAAGLVLAGVLSVLGLRAWIHGTSGDRAEPSPYPSADSLEIIEADAFHGMRPRADDKMTLPRIGFRWTWSPDSARAAIPTAQIKYRVHLVSADGAHEVTRQVSVPEAAMNLRDNFPTGKCEWWVEVLTPGLPPVCSAKETFTLEQ